MTRSSRRPGDARHWRRRRAETKGTLTRENHRESGIWLGRGRRKRGHSPGAAPAARLGLRDSGWARSCPWSVDTGTSLTFKMQRRRGSTRQPGRSLGPGPLQRPVPPCDWVYLPLQGIVQRSPMSDSGGRSGGSNGTGCLRAHLGTARCLRWRRVERAWAWFRREWAPDPDRTSLGARISTAGQGTAQCRC